MCRIFIFSWLTLLCMLLRGVKWIYTICNMHVHVLLFCTCCCNVVGATGYVEWWRELDLYNMHARSCSCCCNVVGVVVHAIGRG